MGHVDWTALSHEAQANYQRKVDADDALRTDLDETRRLLYMALVVDKTKRYNLAGTLINALIHHAKLENDRDDLMLRVVAAVNGEGSTGWILEHINSITTKLSESEEGP